MGRIDELRAMLHQQVRQNNEQLWRCVQQMVSDYEQEVSRLREENSRQRILSAVWSPHVCLNRAEVLQHPAFREAASRRRAQAEPSAPLVQVKQEQEEQWISPEGAGRRPPVDEDVPQGPPWAGPVKREDGEEPAPPSPPHQPEAARDPEPHVKQEPQPPAGGAEQQQQQQQVAAAAAPEPRVREEGGGETGAGSARDSKPGLGPARFIERVYPCPLCGLECVSKAHLRTHMRVHTGERPYSCPECGKAYTTKGALNRHVRSFHRGDRPFRCQFCMFSFTFKSGLERHLRVHTGERPYTCSFCGLGFTQSGNLATHINVHHRISSLKYKVKA